ncbi:hypothetical protein [Nitrosopumilus sp.]|uniref:hypothetical protein n=1 Tax=Nitrosopumilus sp. TaxID=2024843 RepID=UPI003B63707B
MKSHYTVCLYHTTTSSSLSFFNFDIFRNQQWEYSYQFKEYLIKLKHEENPSSL